MKKSWLCKCTSNSFASKCFSTDRLSFSSLSLDTQCSVSPCGHTQRLSFPIFCQPLVSLTTSQHSPRVRTGASAGRLGEQARCRDSSRHRRRHSKQSKAKQIQELSHLIAVIALLLCLAHFPSRGVDGGSKVLARSCNQFALCLSLASRRVRAVLLSLRLQLRHMHRLEQISRLRACCEIGLACLRM
jgi:hypothetical protein